MLPFPVCIHSPHWYRYNSLRDRTNDIPAALLYSPSVLLSKTWLCVTLCPGKHYKLGTIHHCFQQEDSIPIHSQAYDGLFLNPPTYHRWYGQDGVIDLSKASCQRIAFGNQTSLLSCSLQHVPWSGIRPPIACNSGDRIACIVILYPWRSRRGGLIAVFDAAFSALFSTWPTVNVIACFFTDAKSSVVYLKQ